MSKPFKFLTDTDVMLLGKIRTESAWINIFMSKKTSAAIHNLIDEVGALRDKLDISKSTERDLDTRLSYEIKRNEVLRAEIDKLKQPKLCAFCEQSQKECNEAKKQLVGKESDIGRLVTKLNLARASCSELQKTLE